MTKLTNEELDKHAASCGQQTAGLGKFMPDTCYISGASYGELISQAREANALREEVARLRAENEEIEEDLDDLKTAINEALPCYAEDDEAAEREERCSESETVEAAGRELKVKDAELSRLRAKAQLADEMAAHYQKIIRKMPDLLLVDERALLARWTRIENQEAGDAERIAT